MFGEASCRGASTAHCRVFPMFHVMHMKLEHLNNQESGQKRPLNTFNSEGNYFSSSNRPSLPQPGFVQIHSQNRSCAGEIFQTVAAELRELKDGPSMETIIKVFRKGCDPTSPGK